ncbi:nucleoside hydrolase [Histomonas meleagridis]|uniref:nucleoside hydrolase n=1 Tax=Histomonas meleagridis TaxID=135588 RepID=UPI00355A92DC|nr:nucleoside hydrolase [Histomonas meleagridis]KAH0802726.1 nucleoside hydrolase [Histomonas meleagridis]
MGQGSSANLENLLHPKPLKKYKYFDRRCTYRSEALEISPEEMNRIESIKPEAVSPVTIQAPEGKVKVIIDTDIGTDLDDALALLYSLRTEKLDILGLTTMYGPAKVRAVYAQRMLSAHIKCRPDYKPFPVIAGAETQIGTHRDIFIDYKEGVGLLKKEEIEELGDPQKWGKGNQYEAADFIAKTIKENPNEVTIASIGIPTNIALAILKYPEIVPLIKEIVFMGCGHPVVAGKAIISKYKSSKNEWDDKTPIEFPWGTPSLQASIQEYIESGHIIHFTPNHNFSGDSMATSIIFSHPELKVRIVSSFITHKCWLKGKAIDYLKEVAQNLTPEERNDPTKPQSVVAINLDEWFKFRNGNGGGQCPHDPLTLHEVAYQGTDSHVVYLPGTMIIHEWAAFGTFVPHKDGKHLIGVAMNGTEEFLEHLTDVLTQEK